MADIASDNYHALCINYFVNIDYYYLRRLIKIRERVGENKDSLENKREGRIHFLERERKS